MTIRKCYRCKFNSDESPKSFWKRFDAGFKDPYICRDCIRSNEISNERKVAIKQAKKLIQDNDKFIKKISTAYLQRKHKVKYFKGKQISEND